MKFSVILAAAVALVAQAEAVGIVQRDNGPGMLRKTMTSTPPAIQTTSTTTKKTTSSTRTTTTVKSTTTSKTSTTTSSKLSTTSSSSKSSTTSSSTTSSSKPSGTPYGGIVFAHYMLLSRPPNGDYTTDINLARAAGIDAFAINFGGWSVDYNTQKYYLDDFYNQANNLGFKVFLSVDLTSTAWWGEGMPPSRIIDLYTQVYQKPAQYKINGAPVLSTFQVNQPSFDWKNDVLSKLPQQPYFLPATLSDWGSQIFAQDIGADGYFPWVHPTKTGADEMSCDAGMAAARDSTGKRWMAPLAPWFFKRFDYNNNWGHAQDGDIMITRMMNLLKLKPDFIELLTWNDWGESSYFGPADTTYVCNNCYWARVSHQGALDIVTEFIKAYKAGYTSMPTNGNNEKVWLYYRTQPNNAIGWSGDNGLPLPLDWNYWSNNVFVVGLFNEETRVTVTSGGNNFQLIFPAGMSQQAVPWTWGDQSVSAWRDEPGGQVIVTPYKTGPQVVGQKYQYDGNIVYL